MVLWIISLRDFREFRCALLRERWRWALETEHLSLWELSEGNLDSGLLYWGPWRICKGRLYLNRGPVGEPGGGDYLLWTLRDGRRTAREICKRSLWKRVTQSIGTPLANLGAGVFVCRGLWNRVIIGLIFLGPEDVRSLSLGEIWNFSRTRVPMNWHQSMGHKGPF